MNGSIFIIGENHLYCSNDAEMITESLVNRDNEGKIVSSKRHQVVRVMNYMKIEGELVEKDNAYCQFKFDESDIVHTFSSTISQVTEEMIVLDLNARNLHDKEVLLTIKNKIKEKINHG